MKLKLTIYLLLKYYNLIKTNYKLGNVNFGSKDATNFFIESLKKSNFYLEYGSGSSTILASNLNKTFISIESDKNFYNFLLNKIDNKEMLNFKSLGIVGDYSTPLFFNIRKHFLKSKVIHYVNDVLDTLSKSTKVPDLILIDGRYRVLCSLFLHNFFINKKDMPLIIFDDYLNRDYYHVIENFFKIRMVGRFAVLEELIQNDTRHLISKYTLDAR